MRLLTHSPDGIEQKMRAWPLSAAALIVLLLVALVAQGSCLPHTHTGSGLYNAEHDLTQLAASGSVGSLPVAPLLFVFVVTTSVVQAVPPAGVFVVIRDAESRAPPA
jgi:hypothetical protein